MVSIITIHQPIKTIKILNLGYSKLNRKGTGICWPLVDPKKKNQIFKRICLGREGERQRNKGQGQKVGATWTDVSEARVRSGGARRQMPSRAPGFPRSASAPSPPLTSTPLTPPGPPPLTRFHWSTRPPFVLSYVPVLTLPSKLLLLLLLFVYLPPTLQMRVCLDGEV